jgi:guanylate kinase
MADIQILGTVGPSASGKTTLMKALVKASPKFKFILDETSRSPRPNEVDGVDFLFYTKEEILRDLKNGELVQVALGPNGDLYSTRLSSYPEDAIGIIALVPPAVKEFRQLPIKSFKSAFIVPKSFDIWQQWLAKQTEAGSWSEEKLQSRLAEAKQSYEFALNDNNIRFILNDEIDRAAGRLEQVVAGQPPADERRARSIAAENYAKLLKLLNESSNS